MRGRREREEGEVGWVRGHEGKERWREREEGEGGGRGRNNGEGGKEEEEGKSKITTKNQIQVCKRGTYSH